MYQALQRRLELAFVFRGTPFAWRCSICRKLFAPPGEALTPETISDITREFRLHVCYPLLEREDTTELERRLIPLSLKIRNQP
jgi:hypothetical protein